MACYPQYKAVDHPIVNSRNWRFPYSGDELPTTDGWYWVVSYKNERSPTISNQPYPAFWVDAEQRFRAVHGDVIAWQKTTPNKK